MDAKRSSERQSTRHDRQRQRGQSIVETALVLPIIVLLLTGAVDFGRVFYHNMVLASAVREGARIASDRTASTTAITSAVTAAAPSGVITCCTITPSGTRRSGDTVVVTATYAMPLVAPGMSALLSPVLTGGNLVLTQTARMVVF